MKEIMIKTIKEDITYMLKELGTMRKLEQNKEFKNKEMCDSGLDSNSVGYTVYIKDFRPYRSMVSALINTYDNLNRMYDGNIYKEDGTFVEYFMTSLFVEAERLHNLMETCKSDYNQYRCMNDAYIKITDKICRIEKDRPKKKGNGYNIIKPDNEQNIVKRNKMYVDFVWTESREDNKAFVYVDNELIILNRSSFLPPKSINSFAKDIYDIAITKECEIYIDTQGFGMSLYDCLVKFGDLKVNKLIINKKTI